MSAAPQQIFLTFAFPMVETQGYGGQMKSYITCPVCGTKFGKAEEVKDLDLQCPLRRDELDRERNVGWSCGSQSRMR